MFLKATKINSEEQSNKQKNSIIYWQNKNHNLRNITLNYSFIFITRVFDRALFITKILNNKQSQEFLTGTVYHKKFYRALMLYKAIKGNLL